MRQREYEHQPVNSLRDIRSPPPPYPTICLLVPCKSNGMELFARHLPQILSDTITSLSLKRYHFMVRPLCVHVGVYLACVWGGGGGYVRGMRGPQDWHQKFLNHVSERFVPWLSSWSSTLREGSERYPIFCRPMWSTQVFSFFGLLRLKICGNLE
jgi:hypothetical protein